MRILSSPPTPHRMSVRPFPARQRVHEQSPKFGCAFDPNQPTDAQGNTPLSLAIRNGQSEAIKSLLEAGADPNIPNMRGQTPIYWAALRDNEPVVRMLLDKGADPNIADTEEGKTPLNIVAFFASAGTARALLAHGADPNIASFTGETPLAWATRREKNAMVQLLLDFGADPEKADEHGDTPFTWAAMSKDPSLTEMLLAKSESQQKKLPNAEKLAAHESNLQASLRAAALWGNTETLKALLPQVDDLNIPDETGKTVLFSAGNPETVELLVNHGADPNFRDPDLKTPLYWAVYNNRPEIVQALVAHGADPELPEKDKTTPLLLAIIRENPKMVRILLDNGVNPLLSHESGYTPLYWGVQGNQLEIVQALLDKGVNPDLGENNGDAPLHLAIKKGFADVAHALLTHGANPNLPDAQQFNPLFLAMNYNNNSQIITDLLTHGANPNLPDPNRPDAQGKLPLYWALATGNKKMVQALLEGGAEPAILPVSQQLLLHVEKPQDLMNHVLMHRDALLHEDIKRLYASVEFQYPVEMGKNMLPELLALSPIFSRKVSGDPRLLESVTGALTRLYGFIEEDVNAVSTEKYAIQKVLGGALTNWGKIGTMGLSFSRWKFDTMGMWKANGPMAKPPLLVQSGLFKPVPSRTDDEKYFRSFVHYDPASGLSVELRRAYIVISKPGMGSLVIRNSSHHFGRDLFPEPAYYHPEKTYTQGVDLLKPEELTTGDGGYMNVLGKALNHTMASQAENHKKINLLLEDFQGVMDRYTDWKCGFRNGKAPAGFRTMLEAAVLSTLNGGMMSPFGPQTNLRIAPRLTPRLAWINPYDLPAPVASLDLSQPEVLKEAELFLKVLKGQVVFPSPEAYREKMPALLAFLDSGLKSGLELILTA